MIFSLSFKKVMCKTVAILLHYAMMSMFCWMLVEGIHLYIVLVKVFRTGSHLKKYALIGWGEYLLLVIKSKLLKKTEDNNRYIIIEIKS